MNVFTTIYVLILSYLKPISAYENNLYTTKQVLQEGNNFLTAKEINNFDDFNYFSDNIMDRDFETTSNLQEFNKDYNNDDFLMDYLFNKVKTKDFLNLNKYKRRSKKISKRSSERDDNIYTLGDFLNPVTTAPLKGGNDVKRDVTAVYDDRVRIDMTRNRHKSRNRGHRNRGGEKISAVLEDENIVQSIPTDSIAGDKIFDKKADYKMLNHHESGVFLAINQDGKVTTTRDKTSVFNIFKLSRPSDDFKCVLFHYIISGSYLAMNENGTLYSTSNFNNEETEFKDSLDENRLDYFQSKKYGHFIQLRSNGKIPRHPNFKRKKLSQFSILPKKEYETYIEEYRRNAPVSTSFPTGGRKNETESKKCRRKKKRGKKCGRKRTGRKHRKRKKGGKRKNNFNNKHKRKERDLDSVDLYHSLLHNNKITVDINFNNQIQTNSPLLKSLLRLKNRNNSDKTTANKISKELSTSSTLARDVT